MRLGHRDAESNAFYGGGPGDVKEDVVWSGTSTMDAGEARKVQLRTFSRSHRIARVARTNRNRPGDRTRSHNCAEGILSMLCFDEAGIRTRTLFSTFLELIVPHRWLQIHQEDACADDIATISGARYCSATLVTQARN